MLAVPAGIAGCKTIVLATPPRPDGSITPEVLYCAKKAGVTHILKAGGAQVRTVLQGWLGLPLEVSGAGWACHWRCWVLVGPATGGVGCWLGCHWRCRVLDGPAIPHLGCGYTLIVL